MRYAVRKLAGYWWVVIRFRGRDSVMINSYTTWREAYTVAYTMAHM